MTDEQFNLVLSEEGTNEASILADYDAIFHLVSAAKGAEDYYTLDNNRARRESLQEARALDEKIMWAWRNHPNFSIIDNSTGFDKKIERLISEIDAFLNKVEF